MKLVNVVPLRSIEPRTVIVAAPALVSSAGAGDTEMSAPSAAFAVTRKKPLAPVVANPTTLIHCPTWTAVNVPAAPANLAGEESAVIVDAEIASAVDHAPLSEPAQRLSVFPNEMPNATLPDAETSCVTAAAAWPSFRISPGRLRVLDSEKPSEFTRNA